MVQQHPARVLGEGGGNRPRHVRVHRQRADVLDDDEIASPDLRPRSPRVDRRTRIAPEAPSPENDVAVDDRSRDLAGDAAHANRAYRARPVHSRASTATPSSPPRRNDTIVANGPRPHGRMLARFGTEPHRSGADRSPAPVPTTGGVSRRRGGAAGGSSRRGRRGRRRRPLLAAHDRRARHDLLGRRVTNTIVTTATSDAPTRTTCACSTSRHSAAGSSRRSASTVALATRRWRAVVAIEPDALPTASPASLPSVTRTRLRSPLASAWIDTIEGRKPAAVVDGHEEVVVAELHDRHDPAVDLEPELRERDRLHVAHDLLRVLVRASR